MGLTADDHPTDETLRSYGVRELDPASTELVDKHLQGCAVCQRRVAAMSSDEGFLGRLGAALAQPGATGPFVSSLDGLSMLQLGAGAKAPPPAESLPPGLVDHPDYEVIHELGQGGMGTVYLAKNRLMGRHEVLKVVSRHMINRPGALERFLVEIRNAARLHHTNIVTAYSATRIGESIVFAMEYVEGLDLSKLVKAKGPLPVANACNYGHQAALGLQHAHELGMVHRDIKPGNLMLARQGSRAVIKVLDFGLAKVKSEGAVDGGLTHEGQLLGTPEYVAPEQISNARRADIRADIYSLGCTFYYLLTGAPPFQATSLYEILQAHHSMDALPLNLARPEVPIELAALVDRMMAKEPDRRFQTPKDVAQALLPFFKKGIVGIAAAPRETKAEMSQPGRADHDRPSTRALSMPAQPAPQTTPPSVAPSRQTPWATPDPGPAWGGLIEIKESEPAAEPAQAAGGSARPPQWFWPAVAVGLLLLGLFVAWTVVDKVRSVPPAELPAVKEEAADRPNPSNVERQTPWAHPSDLPHEVVDEQDASGGTLERPDPAPTITEGIATENSPTPANGPTSRPVFEATNTKAEFQPLFNGRDLTGWKTDPKQPGNWRVEHRVLVGSGPSISHLYTERDNFADFHLRLEARFNQGGSGGVYFRCPFGPKMPAEDPKWPDGLEATIRNVGPGRGIIGGLFYPNAHNAVFISSFRKVPAVPDEQWFVLDVIADGDALSVLVNGMRRGYHVDRRKDRYSSGHIALQQFSPGTRIEFRKIEIKQLSRWNRKDPRELRNFPGAAGRVNRVAFSPDGLSVVSGGSPVEYTRRGGGGNYFSGGPYSLRMREVASERNSFTMKGDGTTVRALALSSDSWHAASSESLVSMHAILIWDLRTGRCIHRLLRKDEAHKKLCTALCFSPDDRRVMVALTNGTLIIWDLDREQEQPPITLKAGPIKQGEFPVAAFTSDRRHLITGRGTGLIELWDLQSGKFLQRFAGHMGDVRNLACAPDGRRILSAGSDDTLRLWDVASGKQLRQLKSDDRPVSCVAFSPDSRRALSAGLYGIVHLWDLASGKEVCRMEGHTMAVNSVAFSPDGRRAVSGSDDRTVRVWQLLESDVANGTPPTMLETPKPGPVTTLPVPPPPAQATRSADTTAVKQQSPRKPNPTPRHNPPTLIVKSIEMTLRLIPAGEFMMGSPGDDKDAALHEAPQHKVRISPFYLGATEVTQAQYQAVMGSNPSHFSATGDGKEKVAGQPTGQYPVERVTWLDAVTFCDTLSEKEGRTPVYQERDQNQHRSNRIPGYRLPTEAEWECACRAGTTTKYCFGNSAATLSEFCWFGRTAGGVTHPVGEKHANGLGLYDMHGNVSEWCSDWFDEGYYQRAPANDPPGPVAGLTRVFRGGNWRNKAPGLRSASRDDAAPDRRRMGRGFRVALGLPSIDPNSGPPAKSTEKPSPLTKGTAKDPP